MTTSEFLKLTPQQKAEGVFIRGDEQNGLWCRWYSIGQIEVQCHYKNGKRDGEYKRYYPNGQIEKHYIYKDGIKIKDLL